MSQNGLCPFSWIQVTQPPGCLGSLLGAKPTTLWEPQQCVGIQCRLWDAGTSNCILLKEGLASLRVAPAVAMGSLADRLKKVQSEDEQQTPPDPLLQDIVPPVSTVPLANRLKKQQPGTFPEPQQANPIPNSLTSTSRTISGIQISLVSLGIVLLIVLGSVGYWASNKKTNSPQLQTRPVASNARYNPVEAPSTKTSVHPASIPSPKKVRFSQESSATPLSLPTPSSVHSAQKGPVTSIQGDNLQGEWRGTFVNRDHPLSFTLYIKQAENNTFHAEGKVDTWTRLESFEGSIVGNTVILRGYDVEPKQTPGKQYSLNIFNLTLSLDGKTLKGTWSDSDKYTGDVEVSRVGSISPLITEQTIGTVSDNTEKSLDQKISADAAEAISTAFRTGSTKDFLYKAGSAQHTLWREAADSGSAEALWLIGCCYDNGVGVDAPDSVSAFNYYLKAAEKEYGPALNDVGLCYGLGKGTSKDLAMAVQYYKRAANKDRPSAWFNLGSCYEQGLGGLPKDPKQAVECYKKAKELGYGLAEKALVRFQK